MKRTVIPILIFIVGQLASVAFLTLWIIWNTSKNTGVWWLLQGIFLMIPIIAGTTILFVYWTKSRLLDTERVNFISSVSHELLTPLASLRLYIETMMIRDVEQEKRQEFLKLMLKDSERLSMSISKILLAARIESNRAQYNFENYEPGELIDRTAKQFITANSRLTFSDHLPPGTFCRIDVESFSTVMKNLIENAVRYSPKSALITISLEKQDNNVLIGIADEGEGLKPKEQKKIFKMFYRASKKQGGTGIGLYIVRTVIKAHSGKVWAESNSPQKGAIVKILLPVTTHKSE